MKFVIFDVYQRSNKTEVLDEGRFDPGETVDHVLISAPLTLWMGETPTLCTVVHIHFTFGTAWSP